MRKFRIFLSTVLTALFALSLVVSSPLAQAAKNKEKNKFQHPVAVIKATVDRDQFDSDTTSVRRNCTLWVKNLGRDARQNIKVKIEISDNRRVLETLEKSIEELDAGARKFVNFKWEDYSRSRKQHINIWLTYTDDEGQEVTYQAPSPVW
ncbi:MAG: hypothetical protein K6A35_08495 [bacterium]|nr:hypothetical protein [bacterium]